MMGIPPLIADLGVEDDPIGGACRCPEAAVDLRFLLATQSGGMMGNPERLGGQAALHVEGEDSDRPVADHEYRDIL